MAETLTRADLRELKEDIKGHIDARFDAHTVRFDGIDDRLDRVNGRLDKQGSALDDVTPRLATVEEQAKNLSREVFKPGGAAAAAQQRALDRRQMGIREGQEGVTVSISAMVLKQYVTPKNIGYVLAGTWMAFESLKTVRELIVELLKK